MHEPGIDNQEIQKVIEDSKIPFFRTHNNFTPCHNFMKEVHAPLSCVPVIMFYYMRRLTFSFFFFSLIIVTLDNTNRFNAEKRTQQANRCIILPLYYAKRTTLELNFLPYGLFINISYRGEFTIVFFLTVSKE